MSQVVRRELALRAVPVSGEGTAADRRIQDQRVDRLPSGDLGESMNGVRVDEVERDHLDAVLGKAVLSEQGLPHPLGLLGASSADDHLRTLKCEGAGRDRPDAARASGDDGSLARQVTGVG